MIALILWAVTIAGGLLILAMCRDATREMNVTIDYFAGEAPPRLRPERRCVMCEDTGKFSRHGQVYCSSECADESALTGIFWRGPR